MKPKNKPTNRQDELMQVFKFSQADLLANQEGQLSNEQVQKILKRERLKWIIPMVFGFFVTLIPSIIFGLIASLYFSSTVKPEGGLVEVGLVLLPIFILGLGTYFQGFFKHRAIKLDIEPKQVQAIAGIAIVDMGDRNHKPKLGIQDYMFSVERNALLRIKHLEPHIVYFLPRSKIIVSVEVVEE